MRQIRRWLNQPECLLFREVITAHLAHLQAECGLLLIEGVQAQDQTIEAAKSKAKEAIVFNNALTVLNLPDGAFYRARAEVIP